MKKMNVAILGVGVVGRSVIEILQENKDIISARTGVEIVPTLAIARNIANKKTTIPLSTNIDDALNDENIDMIVELIGGVELPYKIALKALKSGKSLVTANKAMLAYHRHELERLEKKMQDEFLKKTLIDSKDSKTDSKKAKNTKKKEKTPPQIGFEASVCGGIPIIRILRDGLCANHILSIRGIMNGTSNYILSKMSNENMSFESALKQAQELGYAEANPALDINGSDSAHKLLILASLAYGINAKIEDILIEGIEGIKLADIEFAKDYDYEIKLLGIAKKNGNKLSLRVHLCMINKDSMLAKVDGAMNALSIVSDKAGESLYYGAGAGGKETASSVVSDIIEIARSKTSPMLGYFDTFESEKVKLEPVDKIACKYYIRLKVADESGVLSLIASILAKNNISIESLMQKSDLDSTESKKSALLLLATHTCNEKQIQSTLKELQKLKQVLEKPFMIRIEDM